jgi:hypothetical protein
VDEQGKKFIRIKGVRWFTNLDHGRRHDPVPLMTMKDNVRFGKHQDIKEFGYKKYYNYDALDVPYADAIPSDYEGVMGVPITFLDKYCPDQFDIIWRSHDLEWAEGTCTFYKHTEKHIADRIKLVDKTWRAQIPYFLDDDGTHHNVYQRIFVRKKQ